MGCGLPKNTDIRMSHPAPRVKYLSSFGLIDRQKAQIGAFIEEQGVSKPVLKNLMKWKSFSEQNSLKKFRKRISKGPPVQHRWRSWISFLEIEVDISLYTSYALADENVMFEIDKDLGRTFTDHPFFAEYPEISQPALRQVLGKFAGKYKSIGYCQGMNSVVGFLLLVSGGLEAEVFFLLEKLCKSYGLGDYFSQSMNGLKQQLIMFHNLALRRDAKVINHMRQEGFEYEYWLVQWIITLCTNRFSLHTSLRIWDNIIVEGEWFIVKLAVAYICQNRKEMLHMSLEELVSLFNKVRISDDLIKAASKIYVSDKLAKSVKEISAENLTPGQLKGKDTLTPQDDIPLESTDSQKSDLDSLIQNLPSGFIVEAVNQQE